MRHLQVVLRMNRRSIMAWTLGVTAYVSLMGLLYMAFGGAEELGKLLDAYPPEIMEAFAEDIASVGGFLEAEAGTFLPIIFGIYLVMSMTKNFAGAEEGGRLDHLLARPISRDVYYWDSMAAVAIGFTIIMASATAGAVLGFIGEATGRELLGIAGMMLEQYILGFVFIALGGLVGAAFHHRGPANGVGAGIAVLFFFMDFAARTVDELDWMSYVSPMGYRTRSDLYNGDLDPAFVVVCVLLTAALSLIGWVVFRRKNLYA